MSSENISVETNHLPQTTGSNSSSNDSIDKSIRNKSVVKKSSSKHLIWAFLLPFGIMLSIYAALGTYPFGESSVLVLDLNGQYVYFFEALRDFVWGEGSLFYSFSRAMGGEFLGMYAYYLASPLSYIVALFPKHMMLEALYLILILKCGLSGLTFCHYINKNRITENKAAQVMFSCMYALSAYGVVMQHNTMWFDCVILLPLVALGIEQLIKERKYKMFTVSLAVCILSNFYIGYMVCIFTFVYFFFYYFSRSKREINPLGEKAHFIRSISRVGIFSAIAVAISACILLPALYSLTFGKNTFSDPNYFPSQKFDFLDLVSMLYPGSYDTVRPEGLPLIYCGLPAIIFLPLFFISKHFKTREKIASGIFALFFVLSFNLSTVDMFWHGMQKPNWLNYRYSFMLCFFILVLGCKVFDKIKEINYKTVLGICAAAAGILIILQKLEYDNVPDFACVWLSIAFLAIYSVGISLTIKSRFKITSTMILCVFVCLELFVAGLLNLVALDDDVVISSYTSYHNFIDGIQPIIDEVKESDDSFYRMEKNAHRKVNDPMALGIRGFSNSTSTLNSDTIDFLNKMGLASKSHWTKYLGATPVFDSLFGVKYLIAEDDDKSVSPLYKTYLVDSENSYIAYENPYALPIAYAVNDDIKDLLISDPNEDIEDEKDKVKLPDDYEEMNTPFERMNAMVTAMLGSEEKIELFKPIRDYSTNTTNAKEAFASGHKKYSASNSDLPCSVTFTVEAPEAAEVYCYFPSDYTREVKLTLNGVSYGTYYGNETYRVLGLGTYDANEAFTLNMTLTKSDLYILYKSDYFFYLDTAVFEEVMPRLAQCGYEISSFTEDSFDGTITVTEEMNTVFTTIPYDKGWQVYIDGEKVETYEVLGALIAFDVDEAGSHSLKMVYRSDSMVYGAIISAVGLALLLIIIIFEKQLKKLYVKIMPADRPITADTDAEPFETLDAEILYVSHADTDASASTLTTNAQSCTDDVENDNETSLGEENEKQSGQDQD